MEEFNCNIEHVLQNRDFSILQKLVSHCSNFRNKIASNVEDVTVYEIECTEKKTQDINKISELQQEIESLKSEIDATKLQQKITDKKIANAIIQEEELKTEVDDAKLKRDNLSLELVDLQQESEKRKEEKIIAWNNIKRACHPYKQYLNLHIHLATEKTHERTKVSFFINDPTAKDKYYVYLIHSNNKWKVEQIQPILKMEHLIDFKGIIDFANESEISDVTLFLCNLRHIFVKYYLNTEQ